MTTQLNSMHDNPWFYFKFSNICHDQKQLFMVFQINMKILFFFSFFFFIILFLLLFLYFIMKILNFSSSLENYNVIEKMQ